MTVAVLRPDSWDLPLFLHVLGAIALTGATAAVAVLAFASARQVDPARAALLRRLTFRTLLLVTLPAYALMRGAAEWILDRENIPDDSTWLGIGFSVSDPGLVLLLVLTLVSGIGSRRRSTGAWPTWIVSVLTPIYVVALLVAMWAMTTKPD